jgi:hypothetical protein
MVEGIQLTLMIGPAVPLRVGQDVLNALTQVTVTTSTSGPSVFELTFRINTRSPLLTMFLLSAGTPIPMVRVVLVATINGIAEVLIDGVMVNHQITPEDETHYLLKLMGEDLSRVMDYIDFSGIPYPAMPREARVALVVAKYAFLGIVPMVIPSVLIDVPLPISRIPAHRGKDLAYVKTLAEEVGYVFYMDPGPQPGMSVAYWGPEIRVGAPQRALNFDMDAHRNVNSLSFSYEPDRKALPILMIYEENSHAIIPIPVPDVTPLSPPLGAAIPFPKQIYPIAVGRQNPVAAALIGIAKAAQASDSVFGQGELDVVRYGGILKARRLVGVRGAGTPFDGLYYVKSVTHNIKRGEYKQSFQLARNALVSTLPKVPS